MRSECLLVKRVWVLFLAGSFWLLLVPLAFAQSNSPDSPLLAEWTVEPQVVSPGDPLVYSLLLNNSGDAALQVSATAVLPAGFEVSLPDLPVGASYSLRGGILNWTTSLPAGGIRRLAVSGRAADELLVDGRLTAVVTVESGADTQHLSAEAWAGAPPSAAFTAAEPDGLTVAFVQQSQGVGPLSYWWDFGDGQSATEAAPTHTFPAGGEYTVRLTAANPMGASAAAVTLQLVAPAHPADTLETPDLIVSDDTPAVGQPIYFGESTDPAGVNVRWNFGDGVTSDIWNPVHTFQEPGVYTVTQLLGEGEMAVQSERVLRVNQAPQASIQVPRTQVGVDELLTLTATSSAADVTEYYWDLGDGQTASHQQVTHSYSVPGSYPIILTVSNDFGVAMDTLTIRVVPYILYVPLIMGDGSAQPTADALTEAPAAAAEAPLAEAPDAQPASGDTPPAPEEETQEPAAPAEVDPNAPADPLEQAILQAINAEREANGMAPLTWSVELSRSAQHHSDDMAAYGFTGHYGSDGTRPIDRIRQASYTGDYAGECTAWGFDDIDSAVAWWMTSPPHRVIVLSTVATEVGGGYGYNPGAPSVHYWTLDFGAQ